VELRNRELNRIWELVSSARRRLRLCLLSCDKGIMPPIYWIQELDFKCRRLLTLLLMLVPEELRELAAKHLRAKRDELVRALARMRQTVPEHRLDAIKWNLDVYNDLLEGMLIPWLVRVSSETTDFELELAGKLLVRATRAIKPLKGERVVKKEEEA